MKPHKYQEEDINFMIDNKRTFNCNSVGLGKTMEAIVTAKRIEAEKILVVMPKSLMIQWEEEINKWYPEAKVQKVYGSKKYRHKRLAKEANFYLINYAMLRRRKGKYEYKELFIEPGYKTKKRVWDFIIYDESHNLKTHNSRQTKGARKLQAPYATLLTATPIKGTPDDLYSQLNLIDKKKYSSYWKFVNKYCKTEKVWGAPGDISQVVGWENGKEKLLKKELEDVMFRKEKEDYLEGLPNKIYKEYKVKMKGKQKKAYNMLEKHMVTKTIDDILQVEGELDKLVRLRQIALDPSILDIEGNSAKTDFLLDLLTNMDGKIVIFSWFKSYIKVLQKELKSKGFKSLAIHGDVSGEERGKIINKFRDSDTNILLGTYGTLSTGLNLQFASNMIHLDKPWSIMELNQAQGRIYRQGQKNSCLFISIITEDSVEEDLEKSLKAQSESISKFMAIKSILKYFKKRVDN